MFAHGRDRREGEVNLKRLRPVGRDGLFCLFLLGAEGTAPRLEASPHGRWAGSVVEFINYSSDGLCDVGDRNLKVEQTATHTKDTAVLESRVEGICPFDVELPLIDRKLTGDVIDDLTLLKAPGGDGLHKVDERSQQGADNNTPGSNQGDKDRIGHNLDRESLLQGMGWALVFSVGFLVGSWLGARFGVWLAYSVPMGPVFQQNVKCPPTGETEKEVEK